MIYVAYMLYYLLPAPIPVHHYAMYNNFEKLSHVLHFMITKEPAHRSLPKKKPKITQTVTPTQLPFRSNNNRIVINLESESPRLGLTFPF